MMPEDHQDIRFHTRYNPPTTEPHFGIASSDPDSSDVPPVPPGLLKDLERRFPNTLPPDPTITVEDLRRLQGQQDVLTYLREAQATHAVVVPGGGIAV